MWQLQVLKGLVLIGLGKPAASWRTTLHTGDVQSLETNGHGILHAVETESHEAVMVQNAAGVDLGTQQVTKCCCKAMSAHDCGAKYGPGAASPKEAAKYTKNWQLLSSPGKYIAADGGQCCVNFAFKCDEIPNLTGSRWKKNYKDGWSEGANCFASPSEFPSPDAGYLYGGSLVTTPRKVVTIHWARHGQACHNVEQKYGGGMGGCWGTAMIGGYYDPPLSNCGQYNSALASGKAAALGVFNGVGFFGSSSLLRTMQTAHEMFPSASGERIVQLPYVKEKGQSYCNSPEPKEAGLRKQQAFMAADYGLGVNGTSDRFDTRYMEDESLHKAKENYGEFKKFFVNTVLREYPKALHSAIVSHSHFISDNVLEGDCSLHGVKMNNNEMWTVTYTIERNSDDELELQATGDCEKKEVAVDMPNYLCESDWEICKGRTPLGKTTKKLEKVTDFLHGQDMSRLPFNSEVMDNYRNTCCVPPPRRMAGITQEPSGPIVKHKKHKADQDWAGY